MFRDAINSWLTSSKHCGSLGSWTQQPKPNGTNANLRTVPEPTAGLLCSHSPPPCRSTPTRSNDTSQILSCPSCRAQPAADVQGPNRPLWGGQAGYLWDKGEQCGKMLLGCSFCTNGPRTPSTLLPFACSSGPFVFLLHLCLKRPAGPLSLATGARNTWKCARLLSARIPVPLHKLALGFLRRPSQPPYLFFF